MNTRKLEFDVQLAVALGTLAIGLLCIALGGCSDLPEGSGQDSGADAQPGVERPATGYVRPKPEGCSGQVASEGVVGYCDEKDLDGRKCAKCQPLPFHTRCLINENIVCVHECYACGLSWQ